MGKRSVGILLFSIKEEGAEVLLVYSGDPFFRNNDKGSWTVKSTVSCCI